MKIEFKVDEKLMKIELMQSQQNVDENLMKKAVALSEPVAIKSLVF
jgi:hypothetical protein